MNKHQYKLGIGPMSDQIIKAIFSYSHRKHVPLMLIASKSQIDYASGYVTTTEEFSKLCDDLKKLYSDSDVLLCRDHCGPGFNGDDSLTDVYKTIDADIEYGFDLIHIDFSHLKKAQGDILVESKRAVNYILNKNPNIKIEIGTEANSGKDFQNLKKVEEEMNYFSSFCLPTFFVCQTGTVIKEINQFGSFDKPYVEKLSQVANKFNLVIKEHNADYLNADEIGQRNGLIGAMNIAPQLGVLQTLFLLEKAKLYGINVDEFLETSYRSGKWKKWLYKNTADNVFLCSIIAGHYCFKTSEYEKVVASITRQENFNIELEKEIHKLLDLYIQNFNPAQA